MDFVTSNRPVVIKGMAAEWDAIKNWKDMDAVGNKQGNKFVDMSRIGRIKRDKPFTIYEMKANKFGQKYK